ncbi:MAG: FIST signal transduction protein [Verrucomicrobiales bacterium]
MPNQFAVSGHWGKDFDEKGLQSWAESLRAKLPAERVSLGLVFMAPRFFPHAEQILEILRLHAKIPLLAGCSSNALITGAEEIETGGGITLGLYALPGAKLDSFYLNQRSVDEANGGAFWHSETSVSPDKTNGWLAFADPFNLDCDRFVKEWNAAYPGLPMVGGLASGIYEERSAQVYLNGDVFTEGAALISIGGDVEIASVISQGCTPIGETWTLTKVDQNLIHQIANRPAYQILAETFASLPPEEQKKTHGNLFVGMVINEYLEEFHRGDFLIRNLLGGDPNSGVLAVGALPRPGQTIQFQRRDAAAASEDMISLLNHVHEKLKGRDIYGACLCSCNGRGSGLFGYPNHDAGMVQRRLGETGLTGFFCNGEIGPIGEKNFLHGYTASLALFVKKQS